MPRKSRAGAKPSKPSTELPPGLSQPAIRALTAAGYSRLDELDGASQAKLLALHGMGPKAITTITAALAARRGRLAP